LRDPEIVSHIPTLSCSPIKELKILVPSSFYTVSNNILFQIPHKNPSKTKPLQPSILSPLSTMNAHFQKVIVPHSLPLLLQAHEYVKEIPPPSRANVQQFQHPQHPWRAHIPYPSCISPNAPGIVSAHKSYSSC